MVKPEEQAVMKEYELSQLCTKLVVGFVGTCEEFYTNGSSGVMMIRTGDIKGSYIDYSNVKYIDESFHTKNVKSQLKCGDILIARHGSSGHGVIFDSNKPANALNIVILRTDEKLLLSRYLVQLLDSPGIQKQVAEASAGSTQNVINTSQIAKLLISIPELSEQKEVVNVCEALDSLIETLERQIFKKKAIKQGAMQELLTGKKRLPGFSGEWQTFSFGALFDFIPNNAFTRAQMADSGKVKNIHYGDILTKYGAYVDGDSGAIPYITKEIDLARFAERCYLQSGDIIIADTAEDETVGKALEVINVDCPILAGQHTLLCRPKIKFAEKFLGYYLNAACYHDQLIPYIVGTKVSSVNKASVAQTKLVVPGYEEQQAIAEILSNMDAEIEALQQKLEKYRQLKQGMMQQLLTGKIRLVQGVE